MKELRVLCFKNCKNANIHVTLKTCRSQSMLSSTLGFAALSLRRIIYIIIYSKPVIPKQVACLHFKVLFLSLTFIWLQVFNTDPAPRRAVIKELHMDTSGFSFSSDYCPFSGVVVNETWPPGIAFHLGPHQVPRSILTGDTAETTNVSFKEHKHLEQLSS